MSKVDLSYFENVQDALDEMGYGRFDRGSEATRMRKEDAKDRKKKEKPRQERPDWEELSDV